MNIIKGLQFFEKRGEGKRGGGAQTRRWNWWVRTGRGSNKVSKPLISRTVAKTILMASGIVCWGWLVIQGI